MRLLSLAARGGLELKHVEHFEDDDDNDNDSDDVEDVSVHGSWITRRYPGGDIKVRDVASG